ncbi:MAG TPA: hypothetical protein VKB50_06815 [Vicinamibacterales bacterium]|nr:hypothetical protein [Vicinamibacterales bacterium]
MRAAIVLVCLLLGAGCDESSPVGPTVGLNERFTLAPAEVAVIRDAGLRVEFVEVSGDSRCPADVLCIQGGDALVHIRVIEGNASSSYELHTGDSNRAAIVHGSVRIALAELQPYPFSTRTIAPGEYRATFTASRV